MAARKKRKAPDVGASRANRTARKKKAQRSETETKTQGATLAAALSYAKGKYGQPWYVFPTPPGEKKSYKAASYSNGAKWGMTNDREEIKQDFTRRPKAGIGVPTGAINGIIVVDADTLKGHGVDGLASLKDLQATHGPFPATLEAESPSGSVHYFFQHPNDGSRYKSTSIARGVDVKADGGMVLVPPTRRPDGAYRWRHALPIAAAPAWLLTLLKVEERAPGDDQEAEPDIIAAAMAVIPNDDVPWDKWNRMGMAFWRATAGSAEGFAIFDSWSQKSSKYNAATTRKRWEGYSRSPPDSIGAGTIFYLATKADPDWLRRYDNELMAKLRAANLKARKPKPKPTDEKPKPEDEQPKPDDPQPTPEDDEPKPDDLQPPPADEVHGITIHWHGEVTPAESRRWLIHDLVPEVGTGLLSGQWGTYKTFVALDMANAVMTGAPFIDFEVMRRGGVLFIAMEGQSEIVVRVQAIIENKGIGGRAPFAWIETIPPLLVRGTIKQLIDISERVATRLKEKFDLPLVMIVVDTMVAAAGYDSAGEDNDTAVQSLINNVLGSLAIATGTFVLGIDHFGKDVTVGTRGSSVKEGNADIILSTLGDKTVTGSVVNCRLVLRKRRGGVNGEEIPFSPRVVDMGLDEHGKQMTTVIINWHRGTQVGRTAADNWGKGKGVKLLRNVITNMLALPVTDAVQVNGTKVRALPVDRVRDEFVKSYWADGATDRAKQQAKRMAFNRALQTAVEAGAVRVQDDHVWLPADEAPL
jgi:hypothetical protein